MGTAFETHYRLQERHIADQLDLYLKSLVSIVVTGVANCFLRCTRVRCLLCASVALALLIFVVCMCVSEMGQTTCHSECLERQAAPAGGHILPDHVLLETRSTWFGFSRQLDVWAANPPSTELGPRIGRFYDVRIPLFYFAVSYQDVDGRVWITTRTPGFFERLVWMGEEYVVERCDTPPQQDNSTVPRTLRVVRAFEGSGQRRVYYLKTAASRASQVSYGTAVLGYQDVARVTFDSDVTWVSRAAGRAAAQCPPWPRRRLLTRARHVHPRRSSARRTHNGPCRCRRGRLTAARSSAPPARVSIRQRAWSYGCSRDGTSTSAGQHRTKQYPTGRRPSWPRSRRWRDRRWKDRCRGCERGQSSQSSSRPFQVTDKG